ncbi:DUF4328 domain-containing protein [Kitasatospora sp. NPDC094028]
MPSPAVYSPPRTTATVATVALATGCAAQLFTLVADFRILAAADDRSAIQDAGGLYDAALVLQDLVLTAVAVSFITWFYRMRVNAEAINPQAQHQLQRGWSIGGWLVPVVSLWFPRRIAIDTWLASTRPDPSGDRVLVPPALLNFGWAVYLAGGVIGLFGSMEYDQADYPDSYRTAAQWMITGETLTLAALVCAILLVHKLTALQEDYVAHSAAQAYGVHVSDVEG